MRPIPSIEKPNYESILFNDLYKFTMQWAVIKLYPTVKVKYTFFDRNDLEYPDGFDVALRKVVDGFRNRAMSPQRKKEFAIKCPFLPQAFFDFLDGYRFDPSEVGIMQNSDNKLKISIGGYWYRTILWEVPLMAAICQLYYKMTGHNIDVNKDQYTSAVSEKAVAFKMHGIKFVDFGTRRAFSPENHDMVISHLIEDAGDSLLGTSNVEFACAYGIKAMGTYAHEFVSAHAAMFGYAHPNKYTLQAWTSVYQGNLGIALPDTFTTDSFLVDFGSMYANLCTGTRHDSGNEETYLDKLVKHYEQLSVDTTTKSIVFSNGLNSLPRILEIQAYREKLIRRTFGIGTWLTNDIPGVTPLNIVIKITEVNGVHAIKISDDEGKEVGNKETLKFAKWQIAQQIKSYKNSFKN